MANTSALTISAHDALLLEEKVRTARAERNQAIEERDDARRERDQLKTYATGLEDDLRRLGGEIQRQEAETSHQFRMTTPRDQWGHDDQEK
jgi:FtsZ-binding cell division protein ZapB